MPRRSKHSPRRTSRRSPGAPEPGSGTRMTRCRAWLKEEAFRRSDAVVDARGRGGRGGTRHIVRRGNGVGAAAPAAPGARLVVVVVTAVALLTSLVLPEARRSGCRSEA